MIIGEGFLWWREKWTRERLRNCCVPWAWVAVGRDLAAGKDDAADADWEICIFCQLFIDRDWGGALKKF